MLPPRSIRATLCERREVSPQYHLLRFELPPAEAPIEALPGQFAMIRGASWGSAPLLPRPMSLLTDGRTPSILIKVVGEGTMRMARASVGEPYDLLAPLGIAFDWRMHMGRRAILVAGGVGVVPLVFLARTLAAVGERPIALYGGRTRNDLPLDNALSEVGELRIATEDGSRGILGRVTVLLDALFGSGERLIVYTCGPNPMMAAVARMCAAAGVPCVASLEAPMACGYGVCLGCNVPHRDGGYLYVCNAGPCVNATVVDWDKLQKVH